MKQLKYIGEHQIKGMIVEVDESEVEGLLMTGEYEELDKKKKPVVIEDELEEEVKGDDNSKRNTKRY